MVYQLILGSWASLPDNDRATLCRWDPCTKLLQIQHVSRSELVGHMGSRPGQPAVVWWRWGAATATHCAGPFQTNPFSTLHHGTQLQHQGVSDQLLRSALARYLGLHREHSRPGEHLWDRKRYSYSRIYLCLCYHIMFMFTQKTMQNTIAICISYCTLGLTFQNSCFSISEL